MADSTKNKGLFNKPAGTKKQDIRAARLNARSGFVTVLLTAVIIAGGFMLPTMMYPFLDSFSGRLVLLTNPTDDMVTNHIFDEPVTLYPWNVYDESLIRSLVGHEISILEDSGVADFLLRNLEHRGMQLGDDPDHYLQRILDGFRYLEPFDTAEPACFVLVDADIDLDGDPDVRCAVDLSGEIISLLFISENWSELELSEPIRTTEEDDEGEGDASKTDEATETSNGNEADEADEADSADTPDGPSNDNPSDNTVGGNGAIQTPDTFPTRPVQEEESLWLFSYVVSREALLVGQNSVFFAFRQLDLSYELRFGYPFIKLIVPPTDYEETLPEVELMPLATDELPTGIYLLKIYDFFDGTRLILYINPITQNCDGYNLSTVPL
ncbi:MAG: hypothetical protein FWE41_02855 [Coriobacteriia bacterium]|nr:hypothetical protein [Coriobacteriia bacterium]MCL2751025.1 hypothetical protein [Coriobacteriia bacterium]